MHRSRLRAFNQFAKGKAAMTVAKSSEMAMPAPAAKVAGSSGIGGAIEYVRRTKDQKRAARKRNRAARKRNR